MSVFIYNFQLAVPSTEIGENHLLLMSNLRGANVNYDTFSDLMNYPFPRTLELKLPANYSCLVRIKE